MTAAFGDPAYHYSTLDTTMRRAAELARKGGPEGLIVTADRQTAGRGRLGRTWISEPGQGLYLSLVLRPGCKPDAAPMLTLVAGLGAKEALEGAAGARCDIRWPNDILIGERKCCGILVEMETDGPDVAHVIVGIGINLNHLEFPPDLAGTATSLRIETGRRWTRDDILPPLMDSLERCYRLHRASGDQPILSAFQQASSYVTGRRVVIEGVPDDGSAPASGVTAGLDDRGLLLLQADDGTVAPVLAGSVRPAPWTMEGNAAGS